MKTQETELLEVALPILQGLLASGHYTTPRDPECPKIEPGVIRANYGEHQDEAKVARKYSANAIVDAVELAKELLDQVEIDAAIWKRRT